VKQPAVISRRLKLLAALLTVTLGGCEALTGLSRGVYGGVDGGFNGKSADQQKHCRGEITRSSKSSYGTLDVVEGAMRKGGL
jgi:hypothetical protein